VTIITGIERPVAIAIHERQLAAHGGGIGVHDDNLLDSALARPQQSHADGDPPPNLADLAASLSFGLTHNHPFVDGNKRTAVMVCETFSMLNGGTLDADDLELYPQYLALAEASLSEVEFAAWLRQHIKLNASNSVNEPRSGYKR
jgi:death-on-curing protein